MTRKRHKNILKQTKGFRLLNSRVFSRAKNAWMKAGLNSYIGRKQKKRDFRRLWNVRINIASRLNGLSYSKLIHGLYKTKAQMNRKVLSNLAITNPKVFANIVKSAK